MANPLKSFLLGRWLGEPLHPAIVHVPIALWLGTLIFDILALCGVAPSSFAQLSFWSIAGGLISTLLVIPAGIAEWTQIRRGRPAWKLALWHMLLNATSTLLFLAVLLWRARTAAIAQPAAGPFILVLIANLILAVGGYLGGRMVYNYGAGVARMSKTRWRRLAAASHVNLPPQS